MISSRGTVELELLLEPALGECPGEGGDHAGGGGEQHPVAALDGLETEPHREVGLADAGGSQQYDVLTGSMKWQLASDWICFLSIEGW